MFQYLIVVLVTIDRVNADEKRLLLTDPDVVAQRLSQLESTVHQLSSTVHQLSSTVKIQSTTIQQLQQHSSAKESMLKVLFVLVNNNVRSIEYNFAVSILFSEDTVSSNDIPQGVTIGFIFSNDQSAINLSILSTRQELLSDCLLYLTILYMLRW